MKSPKHALNKDEAGILIAFTGLLLGGWARLYTVISTGFPINDGGLFYKMVQVLQGNAYSLPDYFTYNGFQIPFAYPPLAFYLIAVLNDVTNIPLLEFFRFFPALILIGTIPAFFELAKTVTNDKFQAGLATLIFSLIPRSITWFIMGGGITRSLGLLFLIIATRYVYLALSIPSRKQTALPILFCSLVVLTHPEAALHMAGIGILIWLIKGRSTEGIVISARIGVGTIILSAVWWLPLLLRFGPEPLLSVSQTGLNHLSMSIIYPLVHFDEERYITFIMVLAFLGMLIEVASLKFFLPAFYFLPFIIELRSAANVAIIPLALLASAAITKMIVPWVLTTTSRATQERDQNTFQRRVLSGAGAFLVIYMLSNMFTHSASLSNQTVSRPNLSAFEWVKFNTPPDSRFLVITGKNDLFRDWTQEWFPAYTERISVTTIQGREWLDGKEFEKLLGEFQWIQSCAYSETPISCITQQTGKANIHFDYIYIVRATTNRPSADEFTASNLVIELRRGLDYELAFESQDAIIFEHHSSRQDGESD